MMIGARWVIRLCFASDIQVSRQQRIVRRMLEEESLLEWPKK